MKAIILAGGRGKRLVKFSENINKCMLLYNNKPLIEHSLELAAKLEIDEIIIVVGYKAEDIINRYGINFKKKRVRYVIQNELKGLVHAIECCQKLVDGHDFILFLGDEIMIESYHADMLNFYKKEELFAVCGVVQVTDKSLISKTYSIIFGENNRIHRLIEKPKRTFNDYMGTGNCIFRNEIFSYIPFTPINQNRNEKELPDLIQCAIDDGKIVKSFNVCKKYVNVNKEDDVSIIKSIQS